MKDSTSPTTDKARAGAKAQVQVPSLKLPPKEGTKPDRGEKSRSPQSDESQPTSLPNSARSLTDSSGIPSARSALSMNSGRIGGGGDYLVARVCYSARRPGEVPTLTVTKDQPRDVQQEVELWKARCTRLQKQLEESSDIRIARLEAENKSLREKVKKANEVAEYMRMRDRMNRDRVLEAEERNKDLQLQLAKTERLVRELRNQHNRQSVTGRSTTPGSKTTPRDSFSPRKEAPLSMSMSTGRTTTSTPRLTPRDALSPCRGYTPRSMNSTPREHSSGSITPGMLSGGRAQPSPHDSMAAALIEDLQRANAELRRRLSANSYSARARQQRELQARLVPGAKRTGGFRSMSQTEFVDTETGPTDAHLDLDRLKLGEGCSVCRAQRRVSFSEREAQRRERDDLGIHDNGYLSDAATLLELQGVLEGIQKLVTVNRRGKYGRESQSPRAGSGPTESFTADAVVDKTVITLTDPEEASVRLGSQSSDVTSGRST